MPDTIHTKTDGDETTIRHGNTRIILRPGDKPSQFQIFAEDGTWHTVASSPNTDALIGMVSGFSGDVLQLRTKVEGQEGAYEQRIPGTPWIASTLHSASSYGHPVYLNGCDEHDQPHSLSEACACGMLADIRRARHVRQEDLAEQLGVRQTTISGWETGRRTVAYENATVLEQWMLEGGTDDEN